MDKSDDPEIVNPLPFSIIIYLSRSMALSGNLKDVSGRMPQEHAI